MKTIASLMVGFVFLLTSFACGRMAAPVAPEALAPASVSDLKILGQSDGVFLSWRAPETDQRGADLKYIDGYKIYKRAGYGASKSNAAVSNFEVVAVVKDLHLIALNQKMAELRAQGQPGHKAKVDSSLKAFSYIDKQVETGKTYIYKVVPFNQDSVESSSYALVSIAWNGGASEVVVLDRNSFESEDLGISDR